MMLTMNSIRLILLMPCIYFTQLLFGLSGSFFCRNKYSANCLNTPIDFKNNKQQKYENQRIVLPLLGTWKNLYK